MGSIVGIKVGTVVGIAAMVVEIFVGINDGIEVIILVGAGVIRIVGTLSTPSPQTP